MIVLRIAIIFFLSILSFYILAQQHFSSQDLQLVRLVDKTLQENHIDYQVLQPLVASRFPVSLTRQLDPAGIYLTDVESGKIYDLFDIEKFGVQPDHSLSHLETIRSIFKSRLEAAEALMQGLPKLDFYQPDSVLLSVRQDTVVFATDKEDLEQKWKRRLKLQVLYKYQEDSAILESSPAEVNRYLNDRVNFEIRSELCKVESLLIEERLSKYVLNAYLKAYCQSFDPHSDFLTPEEESNFIYSLSSEYYGVGITYRKDGNKYVISQVSPFSDASNHQEIRIGDEITGIVVEDQLVAPSCITLEELDRLFYGEDVSELKLELRSSQDRQFRRFKLTKGLVNNSLNHTYSFLLRDDSIQLGYIQFPAFYASVTLDGRSSAEDLALILLDFRKRMLDGVIVDLRNNGGGSIQEAHELISYFTDYGPLFTLVTPENKTGSLVKDTKKGSLTNGKVIFLVNSLSASASELVAAAMQSYPNTLIVGSQTFGKATGQVVVPVRTQYAHESQGAVVATNLKIYRFNGSNYQGTGVQPDIELPTLLSRDLMSESLLSHPLKHKRVGKSYRPIRNRNEPIDHLRRQVSQRNSLAAIDSLSRVISHGLSDSTVVSLRFGTFDHVFRHLDNPLSEPTTDFEIIPIESNEAFLSESERIKVLKSKDPFLKETFQIFKDWVSITNE